MLTQTIILSATKYTVKPTVYMMQGDTGRVLNCAFSDFTVPEGATARLYIHRPNGTFYTETATVDGQVVAVDADQVLTTAGYVNCDLEIEADNETVQSFPFTVRVLATEAGSPQTTEKGVSVAELDERVTALEEAPQGASWGEITGNIAEQTDLQTALNGKASGAVYGYDENTGGATISASGAVEVESGDSVVTTAPTQEFRAVTDSPEHGYSLKIDATDGLKKGTKDPETGEWTYEEIGGGGRLYMHSIYLRTTGDNITIYATMYLSSSTVLTASTFLEEIKNRGASRTSLNCFSVTGSITPAGTSTQQIVHAIIYQKNNDKYVVDFQSKEIVVAYVTEFVDTVTAL